MSYLARHVVWEVLKTFLVITAVTTLMMTLGGGVKEGVKQGLPPLLMLQLMPYLLPEMLRFTVPGCLLFAVCSVYGRMASTNEVVAVKSLGVSPLAVIWPVLALATGLSLFTFWMYDLCAWWGRPGAKRAVVKSVEDITYSVLRTQKVYHSPKLSIIVQDVRDRVLKSPKITYRSARDIVILDAAEAELRSIDQGRGLRIVCRSGMMSYRSKEGDREASFSFADEFSYEIPLARSLDINEDWAKPAQLALTSIPRQIERERQVLSRLSAQEAGSRSDAENSQHRRHELRYYRLSAEPHRRLANGFSCLCFVLLGAPMAIQRRQSDVVGIFFRCFFPILIVYYPLLVVGEHTSINGQLPPYAVWMANIVLAIVGMWFLRRVVRY